MDLGLRDKVAFVAGSTRGIGVAIARTFAEEGARIVVTGREPEALDRARAMLAKIAGDEGVHAVRGDMTDRERIRTALGETVERFGGVDAVVANIGDGAVRPGWEVSGEDWQWAIRVNLMGHVTLATEALPHLIARGGGSLTFVSSIAGCEAIGAPVTYAAAKAAVQSAMKSLSRLAGAKNVRVNAVAPGNVLFPGGSWERKLAERPGVFEEYVRAEVPLQRFGRPEEIANAVVFVASERASFMTGACVVVDGGQTRGTA